MYILLQTKLHKRRRIWAKPLKIYEHDRFFPPLLQMQYLIYLVWLADPTTITMRRLG